MKKVGRFIPNKLKGRSRSPSPEQQAASPQKNVTEPDAVAAQQDEAAADQQQQYAEYYAQKQQQAPPTAEELQAQRYQRAHDKALTQSSLLNKDEYTEEQIQEYHNDLVNYYYQEEEYAEQQVAAQAATAEGEGEVDPEAQREYERQYAEYERQLAEYERQQAEAAAQQHSRGEPQADSNASMPVASRPLGNYDPNKDFVSINLHPPTEEQTAYDQQQQQAAYDQAAYDQQQQQATFDQQSYAEQQAGSVQAQYDQQQQTAYDQAQYEQQQQADHDQQQHEGYDQAQYDQAAYDQAQYDKPQAYGQAQYDQQQYDQQAGYDQVGYDQQAGYDQAGYDQQQYDQAGYDEQHGVYEGQPLPDENEPQILSEGRARDYIANMIGISHDDQPALFVVLQNCLKQELPEPWQIGESEDGLFFYNYETGETAWEIPYHNSVVDLVNNFVYCWYNGFQVFNDTENHDRECATRVEIAMSTWRTANEAELAEFQEVEVDPAEVQDGFERYWYHLETGEATWENPVDANAPYFQAKWAPMLELIDSEYRDYLRTYELYYRPDAPEVERAEWEASGGGRMGTIPEDDTYGEVTETLGAQRDRLASERGETPLATEGKKLLAEWDSGLALKKWMIPDQYAKYLQLDKKKEPELYALFEPLFLVPLMPPWQAKRDDKSRVFFQHVGSIPEEKKAWKHPLQSFFTELIPLVRSVLESKDLNDKKSKLVQVMQKHAGRKSLKGVGTWIEQTDPETGNVVFVHREDSNQKRTDQPSVAATIQVYTKLSMLVTIWQGVFPDKEQKCPLSETECWSLAERLGNMVVKRPDDSHRSAPPTGKIAEEGTPLGTPKEDEGVPGVIKRRASMPTSFKSMNQSLAPPKSLSSLAPRTPLATPKGEAGKPPPKPEKSPRATPQALMSKGPSSARPSYVESMAQASPSIIAQLKSNAEAKKDTGRDSQRDKKTGRDSARDSARDKGAGTHRSDGGRPVPPPGSAGRSVVSQAASADAREERRKKAEDLRLEHEKLAREAQERRARLEAEAAEFSRAAAEAKHAREQEEEKRKKVLEEQEQKIKELEEKRKLFEGEEDARRRDLEERAAKIAEDREKAKMAELERERSKLRSELEGERQKFIFEKQKTQDMDKLLEQSRAEIEEQKKKLEDERRVSQADFSATLGSDRASASNKEIEQAKFELEKEREHLAQERERMRMDLENERRRVDDEKRRAEELRREAEEARLLLSSKEKQNQSDREDRLAAERHEKERLEREAAARKRELDELDRRRRDMVEEEKKQKEEIEKNLKAYTKKVQDDMQRRIHAMHKDMEESTDKFQRLQKQVQTDFDPAEMEKHRKFSEQEWQKNFDSHCKSVEEAWVRKFEEKKTMAELEMSRRLADIKERFEREQKEALERRRQQEEKHLAEKRRNLDHVTDKTNNEILSSATKLLSEHQKTMELELRQQKLIMEKEHQERAKIAEEQIQQRKKELAADLESRKVALEKDLCRKTREIELEVEKRYKDQFEKESLKHHKILEAQTQELQQKAYHDVKRRQTLILDELEKDAKQRQDVILTERQLQTNRMQMEAEALEESRAKAEMERKRLDEAKKEAERLGSIRDEKDHMAFENVERKVEEKIGRMEREWREREEDNKRREEALKLELENTKKSILSSQSRINSMWELGGNGSDDGTPRGKYGRDLSHSVTTQPVHGTPGSRNVSPMKQHSERKNHQWVTSGSDNDGKHGYGDRKRGNAYDSTTAGSPSHVGVSSDDNYGFRHRGHRGNRTGEPPIYEGHEDDEGYSSGHQGHHGKNGGYHSDGKHGYHSDGKGSYHSDCGRYDGKGHRSNFPNIHEGRAPTNHEDVHQVKTILKTMQEQMARMQEELKGGKSQEDAASMAGSARTGAIYPPGHPYSALGTTLPGVTAGPGLPGVPSTHHPGGPHSAFGTPPVTAFGANPYTSTATPVYGIHPTSMIPPANPWMLDPHGPSYGHRSNTKDEVKDLMKEFKEQQSTDMQKLREQIQAQSQQKDASQPSSPGRYSQKYLDGVLNDAIKDVVHGALNETMSDDTGRDRHRRRQVYQPHPRGVDPSPRHDRPSPRYDRHSPRYDTSRHGRDDRRDGRPSPRGTTPRQPPPGVMYVVGRADPRDPYSEDRSGSRRSAGGGHDRSQHRSSSARRTSSRDGKRARHDPGPSRQDPGWSPLINAQHYADRKRDGRHDRRSGDRDRNKYNVDRIARRFPDTYQVLQMSGGYR